MIERSSVDTRLSPMSGRNSDIAPCLLSANKRHRIASFDHLVGGGEQPRWDGQVERFGRLKVYDQLELGRQLNLKFLRLRTPENAVDGGNAVGIMLFPVRFARAKTNAQRS
jgi:hypothetical protein